VLYDLFCDVLKKNWPDQVPDKLPFVLPLWDQFEDKWKGGPDRL
jgi:hypothetical protein